MFVPNLCAHCWTLQVPNIDVISIKAVQSSGERKNGCVPLSIHNIITPQAQISIAKIYLQTLWLSLLTEITIITLCSSHDKL